MKKVTEITAQALVDCKSKKLWNSEVCPGLATWDYYLFGNLIAMYNPMEKKLWISDQGRQTQTTKERLNWILQKFRLGHIFQHEWEWYFSHVTDWIYKREWEKTLKTSF